MDAFYCTYSPLLQLGLWFPLQSRYRQHLQHRLTHFNYIHGHHHRRSNLPDWFHYHITATLLLLQRGVHCTNKIFKVFFFINQEIFIKDREIFIIISKIGRFSFQIGRSGDREIGRSGDREIGRSGDREIGRSGDREIFIIISRIGRLGSSGIAFTYLWGGLCTASLVRFFVADLCASLQQSWQHPSSLLSGQSSSLSGQSSTRGYK